MAVNVEKMKQEREKRKSGGELWDAPQGETNIYVAPPTRPEDDMPYLEARVHYGLGKKGKAMAFCLEPAECALLGNPAFKEQLKALGKDLSGGCVVCERNDRGEWVSGDPEQDGRVQSRWLWIIAPISHRGSPSGSFAPWGQPNDVKGFFVGYRVWDQISDLFGAAGDITDPDAATLVKVSRTGVKMQTQWVCSGDFETIKKPLKLPPGLRDAIAKATKPGEPFDPYRILAGMARPRADVEKLFKDGGEAEYEAGDDDKPDDKDAKPSNSNAQYAPPPGKGKPADKSKQATKPKSNGEDANMAKMVAERGQPPNCYKIDPDANEDVCKECSWRVECFRHVGVPLPKELDPTQAASKSEPEPESDDPVMIDVSECVVGAKYLSEGKTVTYKGPAKGKHYFTDDAGATIKLEAGAKVGASDDTSGSKTKVEPSKPATAPDTDDDDARMAKLEAELKAKKAKKAAAEKAQAKA